MVFPQRNPNFLTSSLKQTLIPIFFRRSGLHHIPSEFSLVNGNLFSVDFEHMEGVNENRGMLKPVNLKETGKRRALKDIKNLVGVPPHQCVANKKPLTDKNPVVAGRPMTGKYAATLANKSTSCDEESRNKNELLAKDKQNKASIEKVHIIDVDIPMVEEPQQMEECELVKEGAMNDLLLESAVDIDSCDSKNPLAVVEYVEDIYNYYRRVEACLGWRGNVIKLEFLN